jgi:hypothetical protein
MHFGGGGGVHGHTYVMSPAGLEIKKYCTGEGQQQFTLLIDKRIQIQFLKLCSLVFFRIPADEQSPKSQ